MGVGAVWVQKREARTGRTSDRQCSVGPAPVQWWTFSRGRRGPQRATGTAMAASGRLRGRPVSGRRSRAACVGGGGMEPNPTTQAPSPSPRHACERPPSGDSRTPLGRPYAASGRGWRDGLEAAGDGLESLCEACGRPGAIRLSMTGAPAGFAHCGLGRPSVGLGGREAAAGGHGAVRCPDRQSIQPLAPPRWPALLPRPPPPSPASTGRHRPWLPALPFPPPPG